MTQTIQPAVDLKILSKIPRFFSDTDAMYRELIQNAVRAGATELHITRNAENNRLTFTDNGTGLDSPQTLLTVAQSGWNESVRDPAGMGVLSTMNPEAVRLVTFSSRDWRFMLTPQGFAEATQVPVESVAFAPGFSVQLDLAAQQTATALTWTLTRARARAPLIVTLNGTVLPPEQLSGVAHDLPSGRVTIQLHTHTQSSRVYWEGFPINSSLIEEGAAQGYHTHATKALLQGSAVVFEPYPDSGVLPKLPDRNAILRNGAWAQAARELYRLLQTQIDVEFAALDLSAPVHDLSDLVKHDTPLRQEAVVVGHLMDHGYSGADIATPDTQISMGDDRNDDTIENVTGLMVRVDGGVYAHIEPRSALEALREAFPQLPYGCDSDQATRLDVVIGRAIDAASGRKQSEFLKVVDSLSVQAVDVPWFFDDEHSTLLLRGPVTEAEATLRGSLESIGACLLQWAWENSEYTEIMQVWNDALLTAQDFGNHLLDALIDTYFPEREAARDARTYLRGEVATIKAILSAAATLHGSYPDLGAAVQTLKAEERRLDAEIAALTTDFGLVG